MKSYFLPLLGATAFSILCYDRESGLNVLLLALLTLTLLYLSKSGKNLPWFHMGAYLYTAFFTFLSPWDGAILMHVLSAVILSGTLASSERTPLYLQGIIGATNLPMGMLISRATGYRDQKDPSSWSVGKMASALGGMAITGILLFVFTSLYASSNPLFEEAVDALDLSFLSAGWVWFTLMGFILYFNLLHPYNPKRLLEIDQGFSDVLSPPDTSPTDRRLRVMKQENLWGRMALGSLNVLLLFYLVLDWIYLAQNSLETPALQSQAVHAGVEALIISIILAMVLLLIFFRGDLNFYKGNTWLYRLSLIWLGLNSLLLTHTMIKNSLYVYHSGLTFKRLGVFLFLVLVGIGLLTVLIKIRRKKSFMYLIRRNSLAFYVVLVSMLALPWGPMITQYNLRMLDTPDLEYLMELPRDNAIRLRAYAEQHPGLISPDLGKRIQGRYETYVEAEQARNWREWNGYHLLHAGAD